MKIGGIDPATLPVEETLVLPRGDQQLVFRARGLPSFDEFDALCPQPKPPGKRTKEGWVPSLDDPGYRDMLANYSRKRMAYMAVRSLEPTEIEWDSVKIDDPSTWVNWEKDLKAAGLSQVECNRVMGLVLEANCLDEAKLQKAREVFQRGPAPLPPEFSGPSSEQASSPSGEPANG